MVGILVKSQALVERLENGFFMVCDEISRQTHIFNSVAFDFWNFCDSVEKKEAFEFFAEKHGASDRDTEKLIRTLVEKGLLREVEV
ncbi:MAG: hypothetical protein LBH17_01355 [Oscillospiraceae bacterium]|jgi:hypothetical protein|nr:hypothetical protein [Oscillospiraceae bacterium]